jgi:hypothetical protein
MRAALCFWETQLTESVFSPQDIITTIQASYSKKKLFLSLVDLQYVLQRPLLILWGQAQGGVLVGKISSLLLGLRTDC